MQLATPALVCFVYSWMYGWPMGLMSGVLVGFVLFAVVVATHPLTVETVKARAEREKLVRDVSILVLVTALGGCALASLLQ